MDLREALLGRRTVHSYRTDPIPDEAVERALAAAVLAPNHRLTCPWRFTRVGRKTRATIVATALRLKTRPDCPMTPEIEQKIRAKILDPAELIVVSLARCKDPGIAREDYASAACAIQNIMLSLHAEGIASKWTTGSVTTHEDTYECLGIDPGVEQIVGWVWAGIAVKTPPTPRRPELGDLVRRLP